MRSIRRLYFAETFILLVMLISGCGITGSTTRVELNQETLPKISQMTQTTLGSLMLEADDARLTTVGIVLPWGKFDENDRSNIAASIEDALAAAGRGKEINYNELIQIHALVRKYLLRTSTSFIFVFSAVEWVAVNSRRDLLFQDTFYSTAFCEAPKICTLGSVKDEVNAAIVERIAKRAILLGVGLDPMPMTHERTYDTYEEAAATMRVSRRSLLTSLLFGKHPGNDDEHLSWLESAKLTTQTDWMRRLGSVAGDGLELTQ
jgi:hypothetical protein